MNFAMLVATLLAFGAVAARADGPAIGAATAPTRISGWFSTGDDFQNSFGSFRDHAERLTEVSPFWFYPMRDGNVSSYAPGVGDKNGKPLSEIEAEVKAICLAKGVKLLPTLGEPPQEQRGAVALIIHDPALRAAHVAALVTLAGQRRYDGFDIDYEGLTLADRKAYGAFMTELGAALHANGKLLTVAVHAKTFEPGEWAGPQAQDWVLLGRVTDGVRIMVYDFHEDSSGPGAIAPFEWFRKVLAFGLRKIPRAKLQIGLPTYGYDWQMDDGAEDMPQRYGPVLAERMKAQVTYVPAEAASHFKYELDGSAHEVWYEDARALPEKLRILREAGVWGIAVWKFGEEGREFWEAVGPVRPAGSPAGR